MIGQSISHYTITEKLGEGGKGVVYKAEDTRLNRTVALKFLLGGDFDDEKQRAGFIREAQTTAALDHPSICTVYEIGEDSDRIFISMAFIDGPDLRAKVQSGPLPIEEVLDISIRVAQGLEAAHAKNVFHCDISNTNIMTTADGQVKIMDFGLARIIDGVDGGPDKVSGTIQYMSPEQIRGENLDQRTDIWSLGICMFEMLTGRQPFNGDYSPAIFYSILNQDPPSLADLRPDVPVELERIVEKAMAKDAAGRFQTATELISRLETTRKRVVEGVAAEPTTEAGAEPAVAVLPFVNMSADKEQEYFCHGIAEGIINFLTQV